MGNSHTILQSMPSLDDNRGHQGFQMGQLPTGPRLPGALSNELEEALMTSGDIYIAGVSHKLDLDMATLVSISHGAFLPDW